MALQPFLHQVSFKTFLRNEVLVVAFVVWSDKKRRKPCCRQEWNTVSCCGATSLERQYETVHRIFRFRRYCVCVF